MKKAIMSVLTVWILVSSMFVGLISFSDIESVQAPYIPHSPFRINNDTDFASMAGIEGWIGNGSPGNPYIIEGYDINGSGYGYCIYIGNTTVNFEVRDSYLHEASGVGVYPYFYDSGIILNNVQNGTIIDNNASLNNWYGIYLISSSNNTIANNTASNNWMGINLASSSNNTIANNTASNNFWGIHLFSSSNSNTIANNTASNNGYGIYLISSSNSNTIANNTVMNNVIGIDLFYSSSNTITNNEMVDNGILISGDMLEHWNTHIIDTTNTVNGKPVHYWKNQTGGSVPLGAGQIILANCINVVVENQNVSHGTVGIEVGFSISNTIVNNTVSSNTWAGIYCFSSSNNAIANNTVSNSEYGICLELFDSLDNSIYHNNIINNTNQAYDITINGNQWDYNYPLGGNYWSDYSGVDNFKGPNQDIPGSDGIGDTPYIINADSQDNYPLMEPFTNRTFENYTILKQGWNLISVPLIQVIQNLSTVLQMIEGYYDAVQWYNNPDLSDPWKHHKVGKPFGNDLFELNESMGFWIHINQSGDTIFVYNGTQPSSNQSIPLHPGWNMVGYPSMTNRNRTAGLNNLTFGIEVDMIWTFDAATQTWEEIKAGDYFEVGRGYWIHAAQECVWEVPI